MHTVASSLVALSLTACSMVATAAYACKQLGFALAAINREARTWVFAVDAISLAVPLSPSASPPAAWWLGTRFRLQVAWLRSRFSLLDSILALDLGRRPDLPPRERRSSAPDGDAKGKLGNAE